MHLEVKAQTMESLNNLWALNRSSQCEVGMSHRRIVSTQAVVLKSQVEFSEQV